MHRYALKIIEIVGLRAVPGLLNLLTVVLFANWLSAEDYAPYSITIAAVGMVALVVFGPVGQTVSANYAASEAKGQLSQYTGDVLLYAIMATGGCVVIGAILVALGRAPIVALLAVVAYAWHSLLQEFQRVRQSNYIYAGTATIQALVLLALAWSWVRPDPSLTSAIAAFGCSYVVSAIIAYFTAGRPSVRHASIGRVKDLVGPGLHVTSANIVEYAIGVTARILALTFGTPQTAATFSFCIDMAQRTVGFFINAATFTFEPEANKRWARGEENVLSRVLVPGAQAAWALAAVAMVVVIAAFYSPWSGMLPVEKFAWPVFALVCAAAVTDRTIKMIARPVALRVSKSRELGLCYACGLVALAVVGAVSLSARWDMSVGYLAAYIVAAALVFVRLRSDLAWHY